MLRLDGWGQNAIDKEPFVPYEYSIDTNSNSDRFTVIRYAIFAFG
jgi:hypothetical protein